MEFKKIPAPAQSPQPYIDPETQMRLSLRLLAKRMLHGARGLLFIAGSLLLVCGVAGVFYLPEVSKLFAGYWELFSDRFHGNRLLAEEWLVFADLFIALTTLAGGWLVFRLPITATLLPVVFLVAKIICYVVVNLMAGGMPNILFTLLQILLAGLLIRALVEARAYRREVALAREYYRSTAILRMKEARR
jgi:hypothetical protein